MALQLKPTGKILHNDQLTLREFRHASIEHESATRSAFQTLLAELARRRKWQLIPEHPYKLAPGAFVKPDATLRDVSSDGPLYQTTSLDDRPCGMADSVSFDPRSLVAIRGVRKYRVHFNYSRMLLIKSITIAKPHA
ncbi:MAG: hypothetical protein KJZ79_01325 [Bryobacteraceae bacterium]|nr:hypothetical protein [Bryobacteraceae bacterium]